MPRPSPVREPAGPLSLLARYGVAPPPRVQEPPRSLIVSTLKRGEIEVREEGGDLISSIPLLDEERAVAREAFRARRELAR